MYENRRRGEKKKTKNNDERKGRKRHYVEGLNSLHTTQNTLNVVSRCVILRAVNGNKPYEPYAQGDDKHVW